MHLVRMVFLGAALMIACSGYQTRESQLDASEVVGLDSDRELIDSMTIEALSPLFAFAIPDSVRAFELSQPVFVSASQNGCTVIIGDRIDHAVHRFSPWGTYNGSNAGSAEITGPYANLVSGAARSNGTFAATDLLSGELITVDSVGRRLRVQVLPQTGKYSYGSQIAVDDGTEDIYEHWFARRVPIPSEGWTKKLALVRVLDRHGRVHGTYGHVRPYPGVFLPAALNQGIVRFRDDTIWFARRSDARILVFPRGEGREAARIVSPPVFFHMHRPAETVVERLGDGTTRVESHLVSFAVSESGHLLIGQAVSYPRDRSKLFRPRTVLSILKRDGTYLRSYSLGGEIHDLTTAGGLIIADLFDAGLGTRVVRAFRNPAIDHESPQTPCTGEFNAITSR